jgi:C-terminal processing protease CtpA/Prc
MPDIPEQDKIAFLQSMSDAEQMRLYQYFNNIIKPHFNGLFDELYPNLQLISQMEKQIRAHKTKEYYQDPSEIQAHLYKIISESEDKMDKYLKEHMDINQHLYSNILKYD